MSPGLSSQQVQEVLILERAASIVSLVGCIFIFLTFVLSHRFRRPINRLIFYASWGNLFFNVATLLSVTPTFNAVPTEAPLCRFQGFLIQMCAIPPLPSADIFEWSNADRTLRFLPADVLWNLSIAINVYLIVFKQWSAERLRRLEVTYILVNYGIPFSIAFTYLFLDDNGRGRVYGSAQLWCWVDDKWDGFRIWLCYAPAWACIVAIFIIYSLAWFEIARRRSSIQAEQARTKVDSSSTGVQDGKAQQEVRVTTEIWRTSYHTSSQNNRTITIPECASKRLFNPFSLDPTNLRGYDPYSITIERGEDGEEVKRRALTDQTNAVAWAYTRTALLYFVSLLITWVPSSMNRVFSLVHPDEVKVGFSFVAALVLPLLGFWNSVIYVVTSWDAIMLLCGDLMLKQRWQALTASCWCCCRTDRGSSTSRGSGRTWVEMSAGRRSGSVGAEAVEEIIHEMKGSSGSGSSSRPPEGIAEVGSISISNNNDDDNDGRSRLSGDNASSRMSDTRWSRESDDVAAAFEIREIR